MNFLYEEEFVLLARVVNGIKSSKGGKTDEIKMSIFELKINNFQIRMNGSFKNVYSVWREAWEGFRAFNWICSIEVPVQLLFRAKRVLIISL